MKSVSQIVREVGPCSTVRLAEELRSQGLSADAARKRIQRARSNNEIQTAGINLAHNQQFVFLEQHLRTKLLRERLLEELFRTNSAFRFPLSGLKARGGMLPESLFATFSGLPRSGKGITSDIALSKMLELGLIEWDSPGNYLRLNSLLLNSAPPRSRSSARIPAEQAIICAFADWLRLQGFFFNKRTIRGDLEFPQFGQYHWDIVAPTYTFPMSFGKGNNRDQGYIVADVILGRKLSSTEVGYFLQKCRALRCQPKMKNFIAWLIADRFEQDALDQAQEHGVIFTTPANLFGKHLADLLDKLSQLLEGREFATNNIEEIIGSAAELLKELGHLQSLNANLRGLLFELFVGHWLQRQYGGTVQYGKLVNGAGTLYDSEVVLVKPGSHLIAIECKNSSMVSLQDVEHWYGNVVPAIRQHYRIPEECPTQEFSIWTTGKFDPAAKERLETMQRMCKKWKIEYLEGDVVRERIVSLRDPRLTKAYNALLTPKTESIEVFLPDAVTADMSFLGI